MSLFIHSVLLSAVVSVATLSESVAPCESFPRPTVEGEDSLSEVSLLQTRLKLESDDEPKLLKYALDSAIGVDQELLHYEWNLYMDKHPEEEKYYHELSQKGDDVSDVELYSICTKVVMGQLKASEFARSATKKIAAGSTATNMGQPIGAVDDISIYTIGILPNACPKGYTQVWTAKNCFEAIRNLRYDQVRLKLRVRDASGKVSVKHRDFKYKKGGPGELCICNVNAQCKLEKVLSQIGVRICEKKATCASFTECTGTTPYNKGGGILCQGNSSTCTHEKCCETILMDKVCDSCINLLITINRVTKNKYYAKLCGVITNEENLKSLVPPCGKCHPHAVVFCNGETPGGRVPGSMLHPPAHKTSRDT